MTQYYAMSITQYNRCNQYIYA